MIGRPDSSCLFIEQHGRVWQMVQRQRGDGVEYGGVWLPPVYAVLAAGEDDFEVLLQRAPGLVGDRLAGLLGRRDRMAALHSSLAHRGTAGYVYRYDGELLSLHTPGKGLGMLTACSREWVDAAMPAKAEMAKDGVPDDGRPYLFPAHLAFLRQLAGLAA